MILFTLLNSGDFNESLRYTLSIAFNKSNSMEQSIRESSSSYPIRNLNLDFTDLNFEKAPQDTTVHGRASAVLKHL